MTADRRRLRKEASDQDGLTRTMRLKPRPVDSRARHQRPARRHGGAPVSVVDRPITNDDGFWREKSIISRRGARCSLQAGYYYARRICWFVCGASREQDGTNIAGCMPDAPRDNYKGSRVVGVGGAALSGRTPLREA